MQALTNRTPHKVKNILIRHSHKVKYDRDYQHPEISYILKYAPKYYQSLAFEITYQNPLFSKVKKIKKLKRFTGFFKEHFPQELWFNLLNNSRKEIEEIPQISSSKYQIRPSQSFWKRFNMRKITFFLNVTKVSLLPRWKLIFMVEKFDDFLAIKERFVKYLLGLRKLRSLEILVKKDNFTDAKWILEKLNGMSRFVNRLENLSLNIRDDDLNIQELFQYKNVFSNLTGLRLPEESNPIFCEILQVCKNLNTFSLRVKKITDKEEPEFLSLLASVQSLPPLESFDLVWPGGTRSFWTHFKPQSSLKNLKLEFASSSLRDEGLSEENIKAKDLVEHWEDIQELDVLKIDVSSKKAEDIILVRKFITMILKKVCKLRSLVFWWGGPVMNDLTCEPILVEEMPHLYESLERFEFRLIYWSTDGLTKFNLKTMKPFRNLKKMKLESDSVIYENVEEIVSIMEESYKEGDFPTLELNVDAAGPPDWLGDTVKNIDKIKRLDTNTRILIELTFRSGDCVDLLGRLCRDIQAVKNVKGLFLCLNFYYGDYENPFPTEKLREILRGACEVRNLRVLVTDGDTTLEYINVDGEKQQFLIKLRT